jgi:integrase
VGGRPALAPGTYGKIRFFDLSPGIVQARALFRDFDGKSRPVTRVGKTKIAAERALQEALRDRERVQGDAAIRSDMRLADLADVWLERIDASDKAVNTKQQYRKLAKAYVVPSVGQLRISEATVGACDRALSRIAALHGPSVGKSCRAVLSGMLGLAARHDAVASNPVRDTEPIAGASKPKKGKPRALTPTEADQISDGLRTLARAILLDMPDLVDFCLATGARIGEVLACRAASLDLEAGTWEVNATVVRVSGPCATCEHGVKKHPKKSACVETGCRCVEYVKPDDAGLIIQERTKSEAGWRVLALPPFAVDMLHERRSRPMIRGPQGVVFGSPSRRSLRDPSNAAGDLKECLALLGYDWPTFHSFRRTVATRMDEAGCTAREIADHLGHSKPSMTTDVYMGRNVVSVRAAEILNR